VGLTLADVALRDATDHSTVLHTALIRDRWNVATHLIRTTADDDQHVLLDQRYDVTGQSVTSPVSQCRVHR